MIGSLIVFFLRCARDAHQPYEAEAHLFRDHLTVEVVRKIKLTLRVQDHFRALEDHAEPPFPGEIGEEISPIEVRESAGISILCTARDPRLIVKPDEEQSE